MSVYGEGLYETPDGQVLETVKRHEPDARDGRWECERFGEPLTPLPTPETKRPSLASIYALNKYDQELQCLIMGESYGVPTTALRFFNVYGPRQALSNPYTGVIAIFASRILNGKRPVIFEDGLQRRDFVSVYDIARGCRLAMERPEATGRVINIGSGRSVTVREIAEAVAAVLGRDDLTPEISGECRSGDIRHCFADIDLARELLGYEPRWELRDGLMDLAEWLVDQTAQDRTDEMREELQRRGLATSAATAEAREAAE
jgi:dTDP-L-rhamnose 4-epimerase